MPRKNETRALNMVPNSAICTVSRVDLNTVFATLISGGTILLKNSAILGSPFNNFSELNPEPDADHITRNIIKEITITFLIFL